MIPAVGVLVHRRKGVGAQRPPGTGEPPVVGHRGSPVRVSRPRRVEGVLIRRPQRAVAVLLQLDEGALGDGRRGVAVVGRRGSDVSLPRHRRRPGRLVVWAPERGAQVGEVQRRERFVIHLERCQKIKRRERTYFTPTTINSADKAASYSL